MNNNNNSVISESEEELSESFNAEDETNSSASGSDGGDIGSDSINSSSSSGGSCSGSTASSTDDDASSADEYGGDGEQDNESQTDDPLELAKIGKDVFRLPRGLCENDQIFKEFFSLETWQLLPQHLKSQLQTHLPDFRQLLPPDAAVAEQERSLEMLFNGDLQIFGHTPLGELQHDLEIGNLRPDVLKLRKTIAKSQRREKRFQNCERLSQLAKELFVSRERLLRNTYKSAPDSEMRIAQMQRRRLKCKQPLQIDNSLCAVRARKRYCTELQDMVQELGGLHSLSADEADEDLLQSEAELLVKMKKELNGSTGGGAVTEPLPETHYSANKKCIYNTFFKRRPNFTDEQIIRAAQEAKHTPLTDNNFKQYLKNYKRRKLQEPHLPEFDTTDIRLRDVCTRAQFTGSFKPGRKPKTKNLTNEPPALVPIQQPQQTPAPSKAATPKREQLTPKLAETSKERSLDGSRHLFDMEVDNEVVLQTNNGCNSSNPSNMLLPQTAAPPQQLLKTPEQVRRTQQPLPKLEPISSSSKLDLASSLIQDTHACYFTLLRDLFCATPQHRMRYDELKARLELWHASPITALNDWYTQSPNWSALLQSAINFLAGDFIGLPSDYVPYVEWKTHLGIYQWIGAGRDSDARLVALYNFWLQQCKERVNTIQELALQDVTSTPKIYDQHQQQHVVVNSGTLQNPTSIVEQQQLQLAMITPPPRCPTTWTVRPATANEVLEFRRQERVRFEQPHRAYTYRMYGYESVVGPVKGIYSQQLALSKARGHSIMVDDRPNFVTILTLVRDATARLPNGEGTRADISELLKCSQYINPDAAENVLQTIVSGALDRMHAGHDPCVRYDQKRKIWIYLHRNRSEVEFEHMHKFNQTMGKQKQPKVQRKVKQSRKETGSDGTNLRVADTVAAVVTQVNATQQNNSNMTLPALVPATSALTVKKVNVGQQQQQQQQLLTQFVIQQQSKSLPVPPLKYNIPTGVTTSTQQQKSLLKTPIKQQQPQAQGVTHAKTSVVSNSVNIKQLGQVRIATTSSAGSNVTTPILVSTPTGLQTVHVATGSPTNLGGKRVALNKPIIINPQQTTTQQVTAGGVTTTKLQLQQNANNFDMGNLSQMLVANTSVSPRVGQQQQQQNKQQPIIRVVQASPNAGGSPVSSKQAVQIIGQRVLAQTTVRPVQQQKISAVSIVSGGSGVTSPKITTSAAGGTVVKMSSQAFAALQQKQVSVSPQLTLVKQQTLQQPQHQQQLVGQQQRIVVGNTAISTANKNIIFQQIPQTTNKLKTSNANQTAKSETSSSGGVSVGNVVVSGAKKIIANNKIQTLNTSNLTPQQQRVLFQNLKQQQIQFKTTSGEAITTVGTTTTTTTTAAAINRTKLTPTQQGQITTRIIRTGNGTGISSNSVSPQQQQQSQIITLDSLLQKQVNNSVRVASAGSAIGTKVLSTANIIQLAAASSASGGTVVQTSPAQFTVVSGGTTVTSAPIPTRNIITLSSRNSNIAATSPQQQQTRLITTQANIGSPKSPNVATKLSTVNTTTKIIGKTMSTGTGKIQITNMQGKPVVLTPKGASLTTSPASAKGAVTGLQQVVRTQRNTPQMRNIVIGGQTVKVQTAANAANTRTAGNVVLPATSQMQTVQILRLQQLSTQQQQQTQQLVSTAPQQQQRNTIVLSSGGASATTSSETTTSVAPKTLVIGSTGQTIRLQPATSGIQTLAKNIVVGGVVNANNTKVVANNISNSSATTGTTGGGNVVFVQGGGQIFLTPNFQNASGGAINFKPLQNMKVVTLPTSAANKTKTNSGEVKIIGKTLLQQQYQHQHQLPTATLLKSGNAATVSSNSSATGT